MSVKALHGQYEAAADFWRTCRDVMAGEQAMKGAGERYLMKLPKMSAEDFSAYGRRALFYNGTARTVVGLLGLVFSKPPALVAGESPLGKKVEALARDVDMRGTDLTAYSRRVMSEVLVMGRCGTFVDWSGPEESRPVLAFYPAEDILNWRVARIGGRQVLTLVVLREAVEEVKEDGYEVEVGERYRVLRLGAEGVVWELWQKGGENREEDVLVRNGLLLRSGVALTEIPFIFHGPSGSGVGVEEGMLKDLVYANLDHFRVNAEFKHGLHFTALPTAWVAGFNTESELRIGSTAAWVTPQVGATAGYLEFRGEGLMSFERAMDRIERLMTVLGARLLESHKKVSESAEALSLRQQGENSILADVAAAVSAGLTAALRWCEWWLGADDRGVGSVFTLNTDYDAGRLNGAEVAALVSAWQCGAVSRETLLYQLERGELMRPGATAEDEARKVAADMPPGLVVVGRAKG